MAIQRRPRLSEMVEMVRLYPSANGTTHGVESVELEGGHIRVRTYCGLTLVARDSRNSRAARWLRRGYIHRACPSCDIPAWKQKRFRRTGAVR